MKGADAIRVQRAMNAAMARKLAVTGHLPTPPRRAVSAYQRASASR